MEDVKECKSLAVEAGYGEKTYVQYLLLPVIIIHVLYIWKFPRASTFRLVCKGY